MPPKLIAVLFHKLTGRDLGITSVAGKENNESLVADLESRQRAGEGGLFGKGLQPEKAVYGEQYLLHLNAGPNTKF